MRQVARDDLRIAPERLRWSCPEEWLPFRSTREVEPVPDVVGQEDALEALRFGLEMRGAGQNIYVRGLTGTGRMTSLRKLMEQIAPSCNLVPDRCYVHNFSEPDRPRLLTLPRGTGQAFRRRIDRLIEFIVRDLAPGIESDELRARQARLEEQARAHLERLGQPFEQELAAAGLALVTVRVGPAMRPAILPLVDGKPVPVERFQQLRAEGRIPPERARAILERIEEFEKRLEKLGEDVARVQEEHRTAVRALYENTARSLVEREIQAIRADFPQPGVGTFLEELLEDLIRNRLPDLKEDTEFVRLYRVNVILGHEPGEGCPIVIENVPTVQNLIGDIERQPLPGGLVHSDHTMVRAGSLLRADGGFLVLEALDVLREPGAWKALVRALRTGSLEITPADFFPATVRPALKPEPIPIDPKVILIGDPGLFELLDRHDPDFPHLFKVLADFESTIPRDAQGASHYAGVLAKIEREEGLRPFSRGAVRALVEHGARIAGIAGRLTARFGRLADLAREASFLAVKAGREEVAAQDVHEAIRRSRRRADLPSRQFRRFLAEGKLRLQVQGRAVGQINGLAVSYAGPLTYGFPTRITATIGAGTAGAIDIEREAQLSGAIHTKGFYILGGLLRTLLRGEHPLAFSASVAFEQSYGGIDGDSASGAEVCCLLSALTEVPLRQDLAMTGAVDQLGNILAVGAVTEKIEGFYDACYELGLTGSQGVIIPRANAGDLTLRHDVARACAEGLFHVYAVETIHEALELLTGCAAGQRGDDGRYPPDTLLGRAEERAFRYYRMAAGG